MHAVAIRDLKARLSEYVRKAREGDVVLVTDRGKVVAELRAPTVQYMPNSQLGVYTDLVNDRALTPGMPADPSRYQVSRVRAAAGTSRGILHWLRGG